MNKIAILFVLLLGLSPGCNKKHVEQIEETQSEQVDSSVVSTAVVQQETKDPLPEFVSETGIRMRRIPSARIPVEYKGTALDAYSWNDANGTNIIVLSNLMQEQEDKTIGEVFQTAEIFVRQFIQKDTASAPALLWELYDVEKECIYDLTLEFLADTPYVTDLDKNGLTETTMVYKMTCRSDLSPAFMKVIMREGDRKYALRGSMILRQQGTDYEEDAMAEESVPENSDTDWATYESSTDFRNAPPGFLEYAERLWKDNVVENPVF